MPKEMDAIERTPAFLKLKTEIFHEVVAKKMVDTYEKEMEFFGFTKEDTIKRFSNLEKSHTMLCMVFRLNLLNVSDEADQAFLKLKYSDYLL